MKQPASEDGQDDEDSEDSDIVPFGDDDERDTAGGARYDTAGGAGYDTTGRGGKDSLLRTAVRGLGQALITLGLVLLLFVVYEVWVTNLFADRKQSQAHKQFQRSIAAGKDPLKGVDRLKLPAGRQVVLPAGEAFANLYIPTLGKDYAFTIVQGVREGDLEKGPGHYPGTAIPGQVGNFSVAGHRVGKGEPFLNLDQLKPGNAVVVQTARNWYVYDVLGDRRTGNLETPGPQGVVGRQIVAPGDVAVIDPVPGRPGLKPTRVLMTMTTCHPKYSADRRMIVHALLARAVAASGNKTPRELGGTL